MKRDCDRYLFLNKKGMMLTEILVAIGVMSVLIYIMTEFLSQSNKGTKVLRQKTEIIDLKNQISMTLSNSLLCGCSLNPNNLNPPVTSSLVFDSLAPDNSQALNLSSGLRDSCNSSSTPFLTPNSKNPSGIQIGQIRVVNMKAQPTPLPTDPKVKWMAELSVEILPDAGEMKLKNITLPLAIDADVTNPSAATVTSCAAGGGGGGSGLSGSFGGIYSWHYTNNTCSSPNPFTGDCTCPTGFQKNLIIHNGTDDGSPGDNQDLYFCYK